MKRSIILLTLLASPAFGQVALQPKWSNPPQVRTAIAECQRDVPSGVDRNDWLRQCIYRAQVQR